MAPGRNPRRYLAHGRTRAAQEGLHGIVGVEDRPEDCSAPKLQLLPPQWIERGPLRHTVHGHSRTAQEALRGIVGENDGPEYLSSPKLQLIPADVVVVHGQHSGEGEG